MEQGIPAVDPIRNRLTMQNEILKRVEGLAQRMQRRAEEVTREVRDLEDRAGAAERDLSGAIGAFRRLSDTHFVENIKPEEKENSCPRDFSKTSVGGSIPAQSYEMDILPRYKEALSLGLCSFNDHRRKDKRFTARSTFNPWSIRGPLPHIIGSEEFLHDNSCGLIEDLAFGPSLDLSDAAESKGLFAADAEPADLFNANLFGLEQGPSDDNESEPLVSTALDFKAMLEAALRSPYKFYEEESSSHDVGSSDSTWAAHPDLSALTSGGLFDSEETGDRAEVEGPAGDDPATSAMPVGPTGGGSPDAGEEDLQRKKKGSGEEGGYSGHSQGM